eukprot:7209681-Prymnesium_polylepis.1
MLTPKALELLPARLRRHLGAQRALRTDDNAGHAGPRNRPRPQRLQSDRWSNQAGAQEHRKRGVRCKPCKS